MSWWNSWGSDAAQFALALYEANQNSKDPKLSFQTPPMSPEQRQLWDRSMGYLDAAPDFNTMVLPQITGALQGYQNLSWNAPKTISGYGLPPELAGLTGYSGSTKPTTDWAALAALFANVQKPKPATPAPKPSTPNTPGGGGASGNGGGGGAIGNMGNFEGPGGDFRRDYAPNPGGPGGRMNRDFDSDGLAGLLAGPNRNAVLDRLGSMGGGISTEAISAALGRFGEGAVGQAIDAIRNNPNLTAAAATAIFGPVVGGAVGLLLRGMGQSGGSGNGAIPGSITGSDAGRGFGGLR